MDYGQAFDNTVPADWEDVAPQEDVRIYERYADLVARWWGNEARAISETANRMGVSYARVQAVVDSRFEYLYDQGMIQTGGN